MLMFKQRCNKQSKSFIIIIILFFFKKNNTFLQNNSQVMTSAAIAKLRDEAITRRQSRQCMMMQLM